MSVKDNLTRDLITTRALAAIVESSDDAILSKDLDGIILSWNRGAQTLYAYTPEEVIGKPVSVLVPDGMPDEIPSIMKKLRRGERIHHFETRRRKKDGTIMDVSLSISPVFDDEGMVVGASTIARDITQDKQLREIRNLLASIIDSSDDAILSKDLDGYILSWNKGAERLYGYTEQEAVGKHISLLTPPDTHDELPTIMRRLKKGEGISHFETVRIKKDGTRIALSLTVSPIRNGDGKIIGASAIARDISARKHAEEEKARLVKTLSDTILQKDVLLQEVYHRVKNNLQVVSSLLELRSRYVKDDPTQATAAFRESINRIQAMALVHENLYGSENLSKLDFLSYLRLLTGQLVQSYNLQNTIEVNITGFECHFDLNQAIPLGLIFTELITNSLKYAFVSRQKGKIDISFSANKKQIRVIFRDNGRGLPDGLTFEKSNSFGFRIIKLLSKQIKAEITHLKKSKGTTYRMVIPVLKKREESDVLR